MATSQQKTPCPGVHEIYNFGKRFLGHQYYILSVSDLRLGVEKMFKEKHTFYSFYPKITSPWDGDHEIYNILSPYLTDATYQIW